MKRVGVKRVVGGGGRNRLTRRTNYLANKISLKSELEFLLAFVIYTRNRVFSLKSDLGHFSYIDNYRHRLCYLFFFSPLIPYRLTRKGVGGKKKRNQQIGARWFYSHEVIHEWVTFIESAEYIDSKLAEFQRVTRVRKFSGGGGGGERAWRASDRRAFLLICLCYYPKCSSFILRKIIFSFFFIHRLARL